MDSDADWQKPKMERLSIARVSLSDSPVALRICSDLFVLAGVLVCTCSLRVAVNPFVQDSGILGLILTLLAP